MVAYLLQEDVFDVEARDIGRLTKIYIGHDRQAMGKLNKNKA